MALTNGPRLGLLVNGDEGEEHYDELMRLLRGLDLLVMPSVASISSAPPGSPTDGLAVIVGSSPSGAFTGHAADLARYNDLTSSWEFFDPAVNWKVFNEALSLEYLFNGSAWVAIEAEEPDPPVFVLQVALSDLVTDLEETAPAAYVRAPKAFFITDIRASLLTASSSGAVEVDIKVGGSSILADPLTIDASEKTSETAAVPFDINSGDDAVDDDAEITFEITGAGTGAKGLVVTLIGV